MGSRIAAELVERFSYEELQLGETTIDAEVGRESVILDDPRHLGPSQRPRQVTVDVFTGRIPVTGDSDLLRFWPPQARAPEPSERNWFDPRTRSILIPARRELGDDTSGSQTRRFIGRENETIRTLVACTNTAVHAWNLSLPELVQDLLRQQRAFVERRASVQADLGFPIAPASGHAVPYRLPRAPQRKRVIQLESGEYPLLGEDDLADVARVIRRWADFIPEHPAVVIGKDEEALRDEILHHLNGQFPSATGETFSKAGKTDIRVVVATAVETGVSDLVFKAECKIWDGPKSALRAANQLADRYITFRETRAMILLFVRRRSDLASVRQNAVEYLVANAGAVLLEREVSGWPMIRVQHPERSDRVLEVVIATIDVSAQDSPTTGISGAGGVSNPEATDRN